MSQNKKKSSDKPVALKKEGEKTEAKKTAFSFDTIARNQLFIPVAALFILLLFNLVCDPTFFAITLRQSNTGAGVLTGSVITVLDSASELAILAIGMTLVTSATGGQDISVGALMAIAGSSMFRILCGTETSPSQLKAPIWVAFLLSMLIAMAFGAFNGILVAVFRIQPMVATLILYTAGRSIAAWINGNRNTNITPQASPGFKYYGEYFPGNPIPTPFYITLGCVIVIMLILKFTNLGLYTQSVGINESSSKLNGLNPVFIKWLTFIILGACVAVAAFIKVSRNATINYNVIAKDIEMDAILAVALGGNALGGGKFNMLASVLGAYVIQLLTTTLFKFNVSSEALPAYKAVVVILLVVFSSPVVREKIERFKKNMDSRKAKEASQA